MKKIFTLLAAVFTTCFLADAQQQPVTMTWNLSSTSDLNATISGEGADAVTTSEIFLGSNLSTNGNQTTNNIKGIKINKGSAYPKSAPSTSENYVQFPFTVNDGKEFILSKVTFYAGKMGSNENLSANIFMMNNANEKVTIQNAVDLKRNNTDNGWYTEGNYTGFSEWKTLEGNNALTFNLYSSSGKYKNDAWFSTIVIEGYIQDSGFVDQREEVELAWDPASISLKVRDPFTSPVLTKSADVPVTFESSNKAVATVDENGIVSLVEGATGTATITAIFLGDDNYQPANAECAINVITNVTENNLALMPITHNLLVQKLIETKTATKAGDILVDDDFIKVTAPYASKKATYSTTAFGYEFKDNIQVRTDSNPSDEEPNGKTKSDCTSLVIEAKKDVTFVMYMRRQSVEDTSLKETFDDIEKNEITINHYWGLKPNDGKALYIADQADITTKLPQEVLFGEWVSGYSYLSAAEIVKLEAGHTYTAWGYNTTIALFAIGYGPKMTDPWHFNSVEGYTYSMGETIALGHVEGPQYIYYTLDGETTPDPANVEVAPAAAPARIAAATDEDHTGKTYNLVQRPLVYQGGDVNIKYLAHKDGYEPSDIQELSIKDGGETTGIENVAVDSQNAPVEFFNLQGVRVENPSAGIFIRRQGNNVSKVVIK